MVKITEFYKLDNIVIINIPFKGNNLPVIVDKNVFDYIGTDYDFYINNNLFVFIKVKLDDNVQNIFLHEIVMKYNEKILNNHLNQSIQTKSIIHKNRINLDNRYENLMYDNVDKEITKNLEKKERIITLKGSGIDTKKIPSFIWYLNPDSSHGERFMIKLDTINWKSPSSKNLSLRYKLEASKQFLRNKIEENPLLIKKFSLNGDLNETGLILRSSFYDLIYKVGKGKYKKYKSSINNSTITLLKEDLQGLSSFEKQLLQST